MTRKFRLPLIVIAWSLILGFAWWLVTMQAEQAAAAPLVDSPVVDPPLVVPAAETAPAAPTLAGPEDGLVFTAKSAPPVGMPTLRWNAVAGATQYNVQISASTGFADPLVDQTTYATSYTSDVALADGTYYWRVKAAAGATWGPYSETRSFDKDWTDDGAYFPELITPTDDSSLAAFAHEHFSWGVVDGAALYLFEISTDPGFSSVVYDAHTIKPHHTPVARLSNNIYYWRVTPIDNQGHNGAPSPVWSFSFNWNAAPALLSPEDNVDTLFLPTFRWNAIEAAEYYRLEISTDDNFPDGLINFYETAHTEFTPLKALSNDQEYYWRVKALDAEETSSPYSEIRSFRIKWNIQPELLSPANNSILLSYPHFAWTTVPGAERYQVEIDKSTSFDNPIGDEEIYNATTWAQPEWREAFLNGDYFWHVRGIDAQGNYTPWSDTWSFRAGWQTSPNLIYPPPYYTPDTTNLPVHGDRTLAWPLFVWDTATYFEPTDNKVMGLPYWAKPDYYVLEVTSDPTFFTLNFTVETNGLAAAPTQANPFTNLEDGTLYYWRVRAMRGGEQMGSETTWTARIDRSFPQLPFSGTATPIMPANGFEAVDTAPVLGWLPVTEAARYRVQVSRTRNFSAIADEALAQFPNYVPWQGRQAPIPFGVFWWRVRAERANGSALGEWSEIRHFNVSRDLVNSNPYDFFAPFCRGDLGGNDPCLEDRDSYTTTLLVDEDVAYTSSLTFISESTVNPGDPYELGKLHVMLDRTYDRFNLNWAIAFRVSSNISANVRYGIYVDSDHKENSGATTDPLGKPITVEPLLRPEYVIYVNRTGNTVTAGTTSYFRWNGNSWDPVRTLAAIGGRAWFDANTSGIELLIPYTSLGAGVDTFVGSLGLTVFSTAPEAADGIRDVVPPQTGSQIDNPAFVTDMLMPLYPFDTALTNPIVLYEMPNMRWRLPYFDSVDGYQVQVARDARFTDLVETWETQESVTWSFFSLMPASFQSMHPYEDNESYYWRVRIRHERFISKSTFFDYGPWSPGMRFKLSSYPVANMQPANKALTLNTPSFGWDRVEGAAGYIIQVDDDANFSAPIIGEEVDATRFTPQEPLPDGVYYWRVTTRRSDDIQTQWSPSFTFVKQSLAPTPLNPIGGKVINGLPTFTWAPVLTQTAELRMAAPRYRLQIDDDPNFGSSDYIDTESTSFTVSVENRLRQNKLMDGAWYWRVAVLDADNNVGAYSPTQNFYKEYLKPELLAPDQGQSYSAMPSFEWSPVNGAAYYEIRVSDEEHGLDNARAVKTDSTRYTPTKSLSLSQLFWRVQMFDNNGIPGPAVDGKIEGGDDGGGGGGGGGNDDPIQVYMPMLSR